MTDKVIAKTKRVPVF